MHVELTQLTGLPNVPPELQVSTPLPEHCVAPGLHDPLHAPETHAESLHATGEPQVPFEVQVWTPLPSHCV